MLDSGRAALHLMEMKASEADIIFIPAHAGTGSDHWQMRWLAKLGTARKVLPDSGPAPAPDDATTLVQAINTATRPVVIVAHSLGIAAALRALPHCPGKVAGAFLVSPPDPNAAELPPGAPSELMGSLPPYPRDPLPFPSITVASRNDPHGSYDHAGDIANAWGSLLVDAGNSGHIDEGSGHGPWPEGTMVFAQFLSRLKPPTPAA